MSENTQPAWWTAIRSPGPWPLTDGYAELITRKSTGSAPVGFDPGDRLAGHLFAHQKDLVRWSLRRGRSAIFADTGLGKGLMLLEWARQVSEHGRVLIIAPLGVGPQLAEEAARFGVAARFSRADNGERIVVTNYEMVGKFDPSEFVGVVLDESSILKSHAGSRRRELTEAFSCTPYRLACTATPAPNDFTELGNHSEFLGLKTQAEMLAEYFVHDGGSTQDWRLKGHARAAFWLWVSTWGAIVKRPSDLGHDDTAFMLPPLNIAETIVHADHDVASTGMLFAASAMTLQDQREVRRRTLADRIAAAAKICKSAAGQTVVWCELNDEQDRLAAALGDACVSISGSTDDDDKMARHHRWLAGEIKTLVTKPAIFGFGLNWQHCHEMVFVGASHSYERTYQAIRRCWRFGQKSPVTVHMIRTDADDAIAQNYQRKLASAEQMAAEMVATVAASVRAEVAGLEREFNDYTPTQPIRIPSWLTRS